MILTGSNGSSYSSDDSNDSNDSGDQEYDYDSMILSLISLDLAVMSVLGGLTLPQQFHGVDLFDSSVLISLDFSLNTVYFVTHLLYPLLHDYVTLACLVVGLVHPLQLTADTAVIIVIVTLKGSTAITSSVVWAILVPIGTVPASAVPVSAVPIVPVPVPVCLGLLDLLELSTKFLIDLIVGVVDTVLPNGVDLINAIVQLRMPHWLGLHSWQLVLPRHNYPRLFLFHNQYSTIQP